MDVSDGLIGDLAKMMRVSGVTAEVRLADVPLSAGARSVVFMDEALFTRAMTGGDDYEILASIPPQKVQAFEAAAAALGVVVTRIGEVRAGTEAPTFLLADGRALNVVGGAYSHF